MLTQKKKNYHSHNNCDIWEKLTIFVNLQLEFQNNTTWLLIQNNTIHTYLY